MVTPSGIQMFLKVGEVVAHRTAADRVGCAMVSDRGEDGVAFKRLGIRGSLAPERPVLHRSSRARAAVSNAFQDAEN
jgi:hypothetical protein